MPKRRQTKAGFVARFLCVLIAFEVGDDKYLRIGVFDGQVLTLVRFDV